MTRRITPTVLLLLIALFNVIAGVPLHYAGHVQELVAVAHAPGQDAVDPHADSDHEEHGTCAWCLTHALDSPMGSSQVSRPVADAVSVAILSASGVTPRVQRIRWPFTPRDPPAAPLA